LDLRQLRYFIAIAEAGSFSAAAERLHIAQPALSQHVLNMEAELGARLLQRNPRGVVATEAGTRLLARARAIEVEFQSLGDHVRGAAIPRGQVRFGMPGTINEQLGVALIEAGRQLYPEVKIRISEAMSGFVLNWLRDGVVDVAMLYNVPDEKGLVLHHALTEEIHLFGIPGLKPWPSGKRVTLATALRLPLILPSPGHGLRELIETAAREIGQLVAPSIEIDSYRQIKQLAARGLAFGVLPATAIRQEVADGMFRAWRIAQPALMRRIYLGHLAAVPLSSASRAIAQLSWTILRQLVESGEWTADWNPAAAQSVLPELPNPS
jgi:LysR family nitrogen assimilation transcriptional regulator